MHSRSVKKTDTANPAQNDTIKFGPLFGLIAVGITSSLGLRCCLDRV